MKDQFKAVHQETNVHIQFWIQTGLTFAISQKEAIFSE